MRPHNLSLKEQIRSPPRNDFLLPVTRNGRWAGPEKKLQQLVNSNMTQLPMIQLILNRQIQVPPYLFNPHNGENKTIATFVFIVTLKALFYLAYTYLALK